MVFAFDKIDFCFILLFHSIRITIFSHRSTGYVYCIYLMYEGKMNYYRVEPKRLDELCCIRYYKNRLDPESAIDYK